MGTGTADRQAQALSRAQGGQSFANWPAILRGFMGKGIPEADIRPRENVYTYAAWRALGRQVRKGEHGVRIHSYIPCERTERDTDTGEETTRTYSRPRSVTVFHVSQTEER